MSALDKLRSRLDELNPRERKLVIWGGALAGLMIGWLVLVDPAVSTLRGSDLRINELVTKAAMVQRAALDLNALQGTKSRVNVGKEDLLPRLETLATQEGLSGTASLQKLEGDLIELRADQASVAGLLQWLAQAEGLGNAEVSQIDLTKQEAGVASGVIVLQIGSSGGPAR